MSSGPEFGKVVVFGVGLIGGSFALALRAAGQVAEVVGFGRSLSTLTQALELGIIDRVGANPGQEVSDADLVLIATPVGQMPEIMARIAPYLGTETLVTDGGSTKADVVAAVREHLGERAGQFVPAHPIAGAENSELYFNFAASGFRDFTRIAASHPEMWRDICLANRGALLGELDRYRAQLDELRDALAKGDGAVLERTFDVARTARRAWDGGKTK